ncbi:MAG: hypothetical protein JO022_07505 [Acidobacteriaceae bacterium]|nr:hypothetical protein [Acidobacteriaceae bacterium]
MKKLNLIVPAALLAFALQAPAQFDHDRYAPRSVNALVDRVHSDLDHAYNAWHFTGGDRNRLNKAEKELRDFASKWDRGKFDKGELDDAISAVQHVLDNNHLPEMDRNALSADATELRNMREAYDRHEIGRW